jgi:RNA-dependent RNA polymerase
LNYLLLLSYLGKSKELALKMVKSKTIEVYGFPHYVTVPDVKRFVEQYTGEGSVVAIKIREGKARNRTAFAIIQFTTKDHATDMMALPSRNLSPLQYGSSYLKVREMERDIVPRPREFLHSLDDVKLYFGCQISKKRLSVLWREENVRVDFGIGMRKWRFSLCHDNKTFKLELSYENIWKIELHQPRGKTTKYLLIQVQLFIKYFKPCSSFSFLFQILYSCNACLLHLMHDMSHFLCSN